MNRKLSTYICYAIVGVFAMVLTVNSPLLTSISKTFSLSLAQSGIIFSANFIGFVVFILVGGIMSDRLGKKAVLSVSIVGLSLGLALFTFCSNFYIACLVMFFIGGFGGIIESMITALVSELNSENSSFYINMAQVFFGIGALAGPILAGTAVAYGLPWQLCYKVLGTVSLVLAVIFIINRLPSLSKPESITLSAFKHLVSDKKFLLICLCMVFYTGSEVGGWGWMSTFLSKNLKFSAAMSGTAVGVFWLAVTAGRLLCGPLTFKYSSRKLVMVLAYLSAVVTLLSGLTDNHILVWIIIVAMGLAYSSQWPLIVSYGGEHYNRYTGTVFALLVGSGGLGSSIVPPIMGIIGQNVNIHAAMISPAVLFLAVGVIFTVIDKVRSRSFHTQNFTNFTELTCTKAIKHKI